MGYNNLQTLTIRECKGLSRKFGKNVQTNLIKWYIATQTRNMRRQDTWCDDAHGKELIVSRPYNKLYQDNESGYI